jgi:effector-binding domain-containing protein
VSLSEPKLEKRPAQPYVGITKAVTMQQLGTDLPPLSGELFQWLAKNGKKPEGAPFWRYITIDMPARLEVEVGVPVAGSITGEGEIKAGTLQAGTYAVVHHHGNPSELGDATGQLLDWAKKNNVEWNTTTNAKGEQVWTSRLEWYHSDPDIQPDMNQWDNELAFLTSK